MMKAAKNSARAHKFRHVITVLLLCGACTLSVSNPLINTFADRTVVQRVSGKGQFDASGTYAGTVAGIEVRAVDLAGKEIRTWKDANLIVAKKQWSIRLDGIPEGGWYRIQARIKGSTAAPIQSKNHFGVGMIVVMMGQSNMQGFGVEWAQAETTMQPHPLTSHMKYYEYKWYTPAVRPDSGLPVILLANNLAKALKIPVGIISIGAGSSSINEWLGDTLKAGRNLVHIMQKSIRMAGGDVEMVCWHQGFNDFAFVPGATLTPKNVKTQVWEEGWSEYKKKVETKQAQRIPYYDKLTSLYDLVNKKVKRDNLLFLCSIKGRTLLGEHTEFKIDGIPQSPRVDCVRWAQMSWAKDHSNGRLLGHAVDLRMKDLAHERPRDRFIMAARWTQSILHALGKAPHSGGGASFDPGQCGFADGSILLRVKHDGGNKLAVPSGSKPIEGFMVRQPGKRVAVGIKKIAILQPDWVRIELDHPPKGDLLVSYLAGPVPISDRKSGWPPEHDVDTAPGNILFDNASLPAGNSRPGIPVQGTLGWIRISKTIATPSVSKSQMHIVRRGLELSASPSMRIGYFLRQRSRVSLRVYDMQGRLSMDLANGEKRAGFHFASPGPQKLPNGVYILRLMADGETAYRKTIVRQ